MAVVVSRVIPNAYDPIARPGGGQLVYTVMDAAGDERLFTRASWDSTPAVPLGPTSSPSVRFSPTRDGVYVADGDGAGYVPWSGARETTLPVLAETFFRASSSGARFLVDWNEAKGKPGYTIIDHTHKDSQREWTSPGVVGGATWLSDSQFLFQLDDETTHGDGDIYLATVGTDGRVTSKKTGLVGDCPAPSPDGATWAYVGEGLVLYDPVKRHEITKWWSPEWPDNIYQSVQIEGATWADATHVVLTYKGDNGASALWVLDVSGPLRQYAGRR
jgi:hypothetical protein